MRNYFVRNLSTEERNVIDFEDINSIDISTHTIEVWENGKQLKEFIGKELERNKSLFFKTHLQWTPYLKSKCWKRKKAVADDIVQDYLIWFMQYHCKFFDYNYKDPKNTSIESRARNYYIRRFNFFIQNGKTSSTKINHLYNISYNESDVDINDFVGGNSIKKNNDSEFNYINKKNIGANTNFEPISNIRRYSLDIENRLYFEGLNNFIENKIEMYGPTKNKIMNFIKKFIITGEIDLKGSFGTTTTYYRNILALFIKEYDHVIDEKEPERISNIRYKVLYV